MTIENPKLKEKEEKEKRWLVQRVSIFNGPIAWVLNMAQIIT
jgi:hypothetical protein